MIRISEGKALTAVKVKERDCDKCVLRGQRCDVFDCGWGDCEEKIIYQWVDLPKEEKQA